MHQRVREKSRIWTHGRRTAKKEEVGETACERLKLRLYLGVKVLRCTYSGYMQQLYSHAVSDVRSLKKITTHLDDSGYGDNNPKTCDWSTCGFFPTRLLFSL